MAHVSHLAVLWYQALLDGQTTRRWSGLHIAYVAWYFGNGEEIDWTVGDLECWRSGEADQSSLVRQGRAVVWRKLWQSLDGGRQVWMFFRFWVRFFKLVFLNRSCLSRIRLRPRYMWVLIRRRGDCAWSHVCRYRKSCMVPCVGVCVKNQFKCSTKNTSKREFAISSPDHLRSWFPSGQENLNPIIFNLEWKNKPEIINVINEETDQWVNFLF